MKASDLKSRFTNETGTSVTNSQGEPDIDYVSWLERIIIAYNDIEDKNRKAQTAKDYAEGAMFGYKEGFKCAIQTLESCLPSLESRMTPTIPPTHE